MSNAPSLSQELIPPQCPVYILCGGQSARFGTDKARVWIDGQPHLLRLAKFLRNQGHETHFVSGHWDRYDDLGIATLVDARPDSGPLAGLVSAAEHRSAHYGPGWLLLISCDQLRWQAKYFESLARYAHEQRFAVTYCNPGVQPIPALYHSSVLSTATEALISRQLSLKRMLNALGDGLETIEAAENPRDWCINTPRELKQLILKLAQEFG